MRSAWSSRHRSATSTGAHTGRCGRWPSSSPSRVAASCASTTTVQVIRPATSGTPVVWRHGEKALATRLTPCASGESAGWSSSACASAALSPCCRVPRCVPTRWSLGRRSSVGAVTSVNCSSWASRCRRQRSLPAGQGVSCRRGRSSRRRRWLIWAPLIWRPCPAARPSGCSSSTGTTSRPAPPSSTGFASLAPRPIMSCVQERSCCSTVRPSTQRWRTASSTKFADGSDPVRCSPRQRHPNCGPVRPSAGTARRWPRKWWTSVRQVSSVS